MDNNVLLIFLAAAGLIVYVLTRTNEKERLAEVSAGTESLPAEWRVILTSRVTFYNGLTDGEKQHFEWKLMEFLGHCRVTGIQTTVDDTDRVLVASSAIIPIFKFPQWRYDIVEVLLYPSSFNEKFETEGKDRFILGMVGTGYMDGKMILSKQALHHGFQNESDKHNTAIHEFVHLVDKADGTIDGIPSLLIKKQYTLPWLDLVSKKMLEMTRGKTDINPYGATNQQEFFAVAAEYFFERPELLQKKHPELYRFLEDIFDQDNAKKPKPVKVRIERNDPCPCSSGKKFKKCCGSVHYR
jgi:MtfA peptidase